MKKVIYSITKLGKIENTKVTGIGYITDEDLITANVSKTGKPYMPCLCRNARVYSVRRMLLLPHRIGLSRRMGRLNCIRKPADSPRVQERLCR